VKTGEIWLAALDPAVGSEIRKTRSCVVISSNEMNDHLRTVIVAPMTIGLPPARFRIPVTFQGKQGLIVLDQIRTLDRLPLVKRMGVLRAATRTTTLHGDAHRSALPVRTAVTTERPIVRHGLVRRRSHGVASRLPVPDDPDFPWFRIARTDTRSSCSTW